MKDQQQVVKIVVYQPRSQAWLNGFRFYGKDEVILLEVGNCTQPPTEFALQDGERVLGIKSRMNAKGKDDWHCDLQFVIGRLEDT